MSRRGNCWDNAVSESLFSGLRTERIRKRIYKTRDTARAVVFDYIEVFTTALAATAIWTASVPRRSNSPLREDRVFLPGRRQSTVCTTKSLLLL